MRAYLDSSVLLRHLLGEKTALKEIQTITQGISSEITRLECLRTLDRYRLNQKIEDSELVDKRVRLLKLLDSLEIIPLQPPILELAEASFSLPLGSLDSIHLATALLWKKNHQYPNYFLTHDQELGQAAKAYGFEVMGI